MKDKTKPEQARASPDRKPSHQISTKFSNGGERLEFRSIEIVKDDSKQFSSEDSTESGKKEELKTTKKWSISTMLILQILTLFVAILALL